ncbi:hypothetical protein C8A03DRAFT_20009, partial [Achaetomium macrosporum]
HSEAFQNIAEEYNDSKEFTFSKASSKELELRQKNATRWHSTYLMIKQAWEKQVEVRASVMNQSYKRPGRGAAPRATTSRSPGQVASVCRSTSGAVERDRGRSSQQNRHGGSCI